MRGVLRAAVLGSFAMMSLVLAPSAFAAANLTSVSTDNHQISAEWQLGPSDNSLRLEASLFRDFPDTFDTYGNFVDANQEAATIATPVPGARYFVRVISAPCTDGTCALEESNVLEVEVPSDAATLTSVSLAGNVLSAAWSLTPAAAALSLEVSTSPARGPFGFASAVDFELDRDQTTFSGALPGPLPPLPYYVLVVTTPRPDLCFSAINGCAPEFSNIGIVGSPPPGSGSPPGSGGPGAAGSATDKVVSLGAITARSSQDVDKLSITLDPGEGVKAKLSGSVTVPGASKVYRFKTVNKSVSAGKKTKLRLKLASKAKKRVKRALRRKKLKAKLTLVVTDAAGNARTKKYTVRLRP